MFGVSVVWFRLGCIESGIGKTGAAGESEDGT